MNEKKQTQLEATESTPKFQQPEPGQISDADLQNISGARACCASTCEMNSMP